MRMARDSRRGPFALCSALTRGVGGLLWKVGDRGLIDGLIVNGSAHTVGALSGVIKRVQTGFLYHYAFVMVVGLVALIGWFVLRG